MDILRNIIMIISLPQEYHSALSKWAAERNLKDLAHKMTAETMAVEAICESIDRMEQMERNFKSTDENAEGAISALNINFPSWEGKCYCCLKHESELNPYGGPNDPLVGDFTGEKLVRRYRPMCRDNEEAERIDQEAEDKYLADGFTDSNDWIVAKYGKEKLSELFIYFKASRFPSISMECRDCAVLDDNDYFDKKEKCFAEWS